MSIQTSTGDVFVVHVTYMDPPQPGAGDIEVSVSNPDVAVVGEDPQHPGNPTYRSITPATLGKYVVGASDGVTSGWLPEMETVAPGLAPPLSVQTLVLG